MRHVLAAAALVCAGTAHAQIFDFETLVHGEIINGQFAPALDLTAVNPNRPFDIAAGFDTTLMGTSDPDLKGPPWDGGNLAVSDSEVVLGIAVIIAQNNTGAGDGVLDDPNDEGLRPAGQLSFAFDRAIDRFGFDVIDIEGVVEEGSRLEFFRAGMNVGTVDFEEFTDNTSLFYDPTIVFGNNTANRVSPITAADLVADGFADAAGGFDTVVIYAGGSSAYDNIFIPAPAPGLALLAGALVAARRRR